MSYEAQSLLMNDGSFQSRCTACATQQAETYKDAADASFKAVAEGVLRGNGDLNLAFIRLNSAGPGIADKADNGDGTIDSSNVTDADLLSLTQANWQVVAGLYFSADGTPKP